MSFFYLFLFVCAYIRILTLDGCLCSGELYPVETDERLCDALTTGTEVEVDMVADVLTDLSTGKKYKLKSLGDVSRAKLMKICESGD